MNFFYVSILDVYDALSHQRLYNPVLPEAAVTAIIADEERWHFDPYFF